MHLRPVILLAVVLGLPMAGGAAPAAPKAAVKPALVAPASPLADLPPRVHIDQSAKAPEVVLASGGAAKLDIIAPVKPSKVVQKAVDELALYLEQMSGAKFKVVNSATRRDGIVVGSVADVPDLGLAKLLAPVREQDRTHYLFRTVPKGVLLIGATEWGTSHAIYHLLGRLGCRWYFPGGNWEIIPNKPELRVRADIEERPDYYLFNLQAAAAWNDGDWNRRNRNRGAPLLWAPHHLGHLVERAPEFKEHPDYYALGPGQKERVPGWWACLSNEGARKALIEELMKEVRQNPEYDCFSMDPADGDGWCRCEKCAKRSNSDWLMTLANEAVARMDQEFSRKYISTLAYNNHSMPPTVRLNPRVIVAPTTSFNYSGNSTEQQIAKWKAQSDSGYVGLYDYWNLPIWHVGMVGARGGSVPFMRDKLPEYYKLGVRVFYTEAINGWAQNGLGYYVANRVTRNIDTDVDAVLEEFYRNAFGRAAAPMKRFYQLLNVQPIRWSDDYLGHMFRNLAEARALETDEAVVKRLDQLTLYITYTAKYKNYLAKKSDISEVEKFLWKAQSSDPLFEADWLWTWLPAYWNVTPPAKADKSIEAPENPWKEAGSFSHDDIVAMNAEGVKNWDIIDYEPRTYSRDLVPAGITKRDTLRPGSYYHDSYYLYARADEVLPEVTLSPGAEWKLTTVAGKVLEQGKMTGEAPAVVKFAKHGAGLFRLQAPAGKISYAVGSLVCFAADGWGGTAPNRWQYFYVPKGERKVVLFAHDNRQEISDKDGNVLYLRQEPAPHESGFIVLPVPPGQDGGAWRIRGLSSSGPMEFLTVPPYLAQSPDELLVPKEVLGK